MLPQLSPSVQSEVDAGISSLQNTNIPAFVNLYRYLTASVLDHDVSTRSKTQVYEVNGTAQRLNKVHQQFARDAILLRVLKEICHSYSDEIDLTREVRELCYIISMYLSSIQTGHLVVDEETENLMADEISEFRHSLPVVASALSSHLNGLESTMSNMLELLDLDSIQEQPSTSTMINSRIPSSQRTTTSTTRAYKPTISSDKHTSKITSSSSLLQSHINSQTQLIQKTLPSLLNTLTTTLHALLTTLSTHLTTTIRHAELHTHSILSRHLTSHATFLATVAQGLNLKSQILALQREKETYAEAGVQEALKNRFDTLENEERGLREREERLRRLLAEYEREGGGGRAEGVKGIEVFETLGKGYRDVEMEIEVVRGDIERLERKVEESSGGGGGGGVGRARGARR